MAELRIPDLRHVVLAGRLGQQPALSYTPGGHALATASLALTVPRTGGEKDTLWIDVKFWGKTAEGVAELAKGAAVLLYGRLDVERWKDRKSGEERVKTVVRADRFQALEWDARGSADQRADTRRAPRRDATEPTTEDDIPF